MTETEAIKEHTSLFDLYDADGCLVGKANPGKKVMLADAFYVPERTCRNVFPQDGILPNYPETMFQCSECGCMVTDCESYAIIIENGDWHYCPNCGARVVE